MSKIHTITHCSYIFGCRHRLNTTSLDQLINLFQSPSTDETAELEGRAPARFAVLSQTGSVVVKAYKRGGLIPLINKARYIKTGRFRSQREFDFLMAAQKAGVKVPEPVAYASTGSLFYKAWLITKQIKGHRSFAGLCRTDPEKAMALMPEISRNINKLIRSRIHHVDLHPGNILLDGNNTIFIIDFDKARQYSKNKIRLSVDYQNRWARAIHKYNLPKPLAFLGL